MRRALLLVENASVPSDPRVWAEACAIRDAGWSVTVVGPQGRRDMAPRERLEEIDLVRFPHAPASGGALGYVREYASALWHVRRAVNILERDGAIDVIHAATPPDVLLLAARKARRRGTATILDHHDLSPELFEAKFGRRGAVYQSLRRAERLGFVNADVVISTNESFRRRALEQGGHQPDDVFVVRNGPDPAIFRPQPPDPALRTRAPFLVGFVGLMGSQDGVLEAMQILGLLGRIRSDWHAVFVGDGEMLEPARRLLAELGISSHVTFAGFVSDRQVVARMIASCDVCISPEPKNPLNDRSTLIKIGEYMAVERPIVAFGLTESRFTAGDAAVFVDTQEEFASAISALLDAPERRREMGATGRARISGELSWARSRDALLAAYERALVRASSRCTRRHSL